MAKVEGEDEDKDDGIDIEYEDIYSLIQFLLGFYKSCPK